MMKKIPLTEIKSREEAQQIAIDWQSWVSEQNLSYKELMGWQSYFLDLASKFYLMEEFRENSII